MKIGEFFSWQILNENIALKKCDLSFFKYGQTGIPKNIAWFFECENLQGGDSKEIKILYKGTEYFWVLHCDRTKSKRLNLRWNYEMQKIIQQDCNQGIDEYFLLLRKTRDEEYILEFINSDQGSTNEENDDLETNVYGKEGKIKEVYSKKYERSQKNRILAMAIHGTKCMVCGFDFKQVYGDLGSGFIEVHHVKPLSSLTEEMEINPHTDLVCLCSNCHRMIHRNKNQILTIDELKALLETSSN